MMCGVGGEHLGRHSFVLASPASIFLFVQKSETPFSVDVGMTQMCTSVGLFPLFIPKCSKNSYNKLGQSPWPPFPMTGLEACRHGSPQAFPALPLRLPSAPGRSRGLHSRCTLTSLGSYHMSVLWSLGSLDSRPALLPAPLAPV